MANSTGIAPFMRKNKQTPEMCLEGCTQTDSRLISLIKERFINPPSAQPYNFDSSPPSLNGQIGQPAYVDHLLGQQQNGFFIECGANRGEQISNSLFFEMERNWTGLLIEADPVNFQHLIRKNRKAFSLDACLSMTTESTKIKFISANLYGGIAGVPVPPHVESYRKVEEANEVTVQCFPLYSVLLALGNPVVDYFSFDVEGSEMPILRTIPWEKVKIRVLTIEYNSDDKVKEEMTEFMGSKGYSMVNVMAGQDLVFVHEDVRVNS